LVKKNSKKLKLGYLNINSIQNKFIALRSVLDDDMDVLAIAETKIDESFPTSRQLNCPGVAKDIQIIPVLQFRSYQLKCVILLRVTLIVSLTLLFLLTF